MQDVGVVQHDSNVLRGHCDDPDDVENESAEASNPDLATERVDQSATERVDQSATERVDQSATERVDHSATERVDQSATEGVDQSATEGVDQSVLTIVVSADELVNSEAPTLIADPVGDISTIEKIAIVESPKKPNLSRNHSSHEQCRVCQEEKEEELIDLGCHCRGGLAKAHQTCIETWFSTRGSNKCEICQQVAENVASPEAHTPTSYWIWRVDPSFRGANMSQERDRGCLNPLWVAFCILIGGLFLDVLISITLGVSALPVNIIIGVIVVLGLGTALRLALEFCHDRSVRSVVHRLEGNVSLGYHPTV